MDDNTTGNGAGRGDGKRGGGATPILVAVTAAFGVARLVLELAKTEIVIDAGVRAWSSASSIATGLLAASAVAAAASAVRGLASRARERDAERESAAASAAAAASVAEAERPGSLSMRGRLDPGAMRDMLVTSVMDGWGGMRADADACGSQMAKMERLSGKLERLLEDNDAGRLSNTVDALSQAEQYMLRNVRRVVNCMRACDPADPDGQAKTAGRMAECLEGNEKILEQAQDLIDAVTDFLNSQGGDDTAEETLEAYTQAILGSVEDGK